MRARRLKNEINVVPYIDVMLVLLVIFMVAAPMMTTGSVDLPTTGKSSQVPSNPTRVMVKSDGSIAIKDPKGNDSSVDKAGLVSYLRAEQAKNPELAVLVAGDRNAVLDVLDSIKQQDVKRVGLETVRKQ
jgi:biopolymer transport protein TolR